MGIRPDGQSVKGTTRVSYGDRRLMRSLFIHVKASRQERARDNRKLTKNDKDAANEMPMRRARRSFTAYWKKVRTAPKRFEAAANDTDALATRVMTSSTWIDFVDRWRALEADRVELSSVAACARRCAAAAQKRNRASDKDAPLELHIEQLLHDVFGKSKDGSELHETATLTARLHRSFVLDEDDEQANAESQLDWTGVAHFLGAAVVEATVPTEDMPLLHTRRNVRLLHHYARVRAARAAYRESTSRTCEFAQVHMGKRKRREQDALSARHSAQDDGGEGGIGDTASVKKKKNSYGAQCAAWAAQVLDSDRGYEYVHVSHDGPDVSLTGAAPSSMYWLEPNYFDVRGSSVIDVLRDYSTIDDEMRRAHRDRFGVIDVSPSSASASTVTTPSPSAERRQRLLSASTGGSADTDTATPSPLAISLQQRQNTVDFVTAHEVERHANLWTVCHRCGEPLHTCDMVVTRGLLAHDVSCYHAQCSAEYSLLQRRHRRRRAGLVVPQVAATPAAKKPASKRKRPAKEVASDKHVVHEHRKEAKVDRTASPLLDRLEREMVVRSAAPR